MKAYVAVMAVIFTLVFFTWGGARIVNNIQFDRNADGYLKRAADANTIELAKKNLAVAVKYLEENSLTSGYTSILWRTPDEDVGFWYDNLKASLKELEGVSSDATQLEKTNILMKLRETLLDQGQKGVHVTAPSGITVFPNNTFYVMWGAISFILAAYFFAIFFKDLDL
ncbi:MAG: hypothetical protein AAB527_00245 [Patescibacteria group bacterium]